MPKCSICGKELDKIEKVAAVVVRGKLVCRDCQKEFFEQIKEEITVDLDIM